MFPKSPSFYKNDGYRKFISEKPCLVCDKPGCDPHHWHTFASQRNDLFCIPLCREHHTLFHNIGVKSFLAETNIRQDYVYKTMVLYITEYLGLK